MVNIYNRAIKEAGYKPSIFMGMVSEHGGLETARRLLHYKDVSEGYIKLWERGRLDLTVEAVIFDNPKWHALFTEQELEIAEKRLKKYEYQFQ